MEAHNASTDAINASQTDADVHGRTKIKPGDRVKFGRNWVRVVEIYPEKGKMKVFEGGRKVDTRFAADVVGYEPRD